ncbi:cell division protein ZipA [Photobacterium gaetbulicola]|uniref:Cell division protein ZipA n=1 Tax=Photobacterium gaetbulicola Gung47 TaxID=658445 RepID=A0A0C5X2M2_9GAMM|nr:cell division protein ZipA [Photobacterium gaetbulicola]AJR09600.1 putative cell division protein ZipA [Photobacterium gaetbulicola Gung47]PSU14394.1 cell division protein ZipA [Photobacterium gaetbulicola]
MQELRLVLIIVGALAIAGLLLHGLWSSRKEKPAKFGEKPLGKLDKAARDSEGFDKDGVGSVRVVNSEPLNAEAPRHERKEPELHFGAKLDADPLLDGAAPEQPAVVAASPVAVQSAPAAVTRADKPVAAEPQAPEPASSQAESVAVAEPPSHPQPQQQSARTVEKVEPVLNVASAEQVTVEDEPVLDNSLSPAAEQAAALGVEAKSQSAAAESAMPASAEPVTSKLDATDSPTEALHAEASEPVVAAEPAVESTEPVEEPQKPAEKEVLPPDYLVLNVHARNGELFRGSRLFNAFEQNHLIFGENSVYHRHADAAGTGPAIFSVTNMVHPAHFPQGGSESFETPGVAFYLMLPCEVGRADQNFNLMLQTVQRIADSLGGDVLDHERNLITPHRISGYRDKAQRYTVS